MQISLGLKKAMALTGVAVLSLELTGCATVVNGRYQNVNIVTKPAGASCQLSNNKGHWNVTQTPQIIAVHRSYYPLKIMCMKPGYRNVVTKFDSSTKKMVAGNILVGGIIGGGVDVADGAAYSYPNTMTIYMTKERAVRTVVKKVIIKQQPSAK